ncbi:MAG TPA: UvrB/UvrC motif-containing protein [Candidatus Acidoferrales bacterium]|jgi:excinuclease UvrABC nuclease subunit|nr:UvrB/UvrC motif-containing protein [Candidatus Acidoferrales bacterium]
MQELDSSIQFDQARDEEFFASVPAKPAVFAIEPRAELIDAKPYLLRTANLRQRLARLLGSPDPASKRLNLREFAGGVRYRVVGSPYELSFLHWQHARRMWPSSYRERARIRPPAVLKVSLKNAYPRCYATRRISANGFYFGPFSSRREADTFASGSLDLFKIRRCQIKIRRDPEFPGCIYSEMKMCLAPCFAGCTQEEYDAEVARVVAFLSTRGGSLTAELEREREAASEALDFERAAAVHRRVEKAAEALRGLPDLARRIEDLNAVVLQRAAEENTVTVFVVRAGRIEEPRLLRFAELAGEPRSVEQILREWLEGAGNADSILVKASASHQQSFRELEDHLSLLTRWFHKKPRAGEIFFREATARSSTAAPQDEASARRNSEWPYRRILRACSRLLTPPTEETPTES